MKILALVALLFLAGCNDAFWQQRVTFTAYGFTMVTPYGPFSLGYITWTRNYDNPSTPSDPADIVTGSLLEGIKK